MAEIHHPELLAIKRILEETQIGLDKLEAEKKEYTQQEYDVRRKQKLVLAVKRINDTLQVLKLNAQL